jgi:hypothetical protein
LTSEDGRVGHMSVDGLTVQWPSHETKTELD